MIAREKKKRPTTQLEPMKINKYNYKLDTLLFVILAARSLNRRQPLRLNYDMLSYLATKREEAKYGGYLCSISSYHKDMLHENKRKLKRPRKKNERKHLDMKRRMNRHYLMCRITFVFFFLVFHFIGRLSIRFDGHSRVSFEVKFIIEN
ncbi:unnamed protein product [Rotaria magnacalcarata]